ncbi:MAG: hypothetical protein AAF721_16640, partial [Myxococcota bacterium]
MSLRPDVVSCTATRRVARRGRRASTTALLPGLIAGLATLCGLDASAAPGDTTRPAASATAHVVTETSQVLPRWTPSAGALTSYGQVIGNDDAGGVVVRRRTTTNLTFAFGLFDRAELLADLPMVLHQQGTATDATGDPATSAG